MSKIKKFQESIDFHQTDESSHVGECLKSDKLTFSKYWQKTNKNKSSKNAGNARGQKIQKK